MLNLLGEKYLELDPGRRGPARRGHRRSRVERTESAYDIVGVFGDLTTTTEQIDTDQLDAGARRRRRHDRTRPRRRSRRASTASPGSRETVASRDAQIQALLASSRDVTQLLGDRSEDLVALMENGDLVFQEVTAPQGGDPPAAGQRARSSPTQLRGVADGQPGADRPGAAPRSTTCSTCSISKEKELKATLAALGPYVSILGNIIGTGPWFDAYAVQPGRDPDRRVPARPPEATPMSRAAAARPPGRRRRRGGRSLLAGHVLLRCRDGTETKTVTAHFPRAVSVYVGTDVRILGVNVGKVTAVIPEGNSVRVEMEYDARVRRARRRQGGRSSRRPWSPTGSSSSPRRTTRATVMADGADIPLPDTGVPVELDRIYASLARPDRGARPQRRQQGRHPRPRCSRPAPTRSRATARCGNEMIRTSPRRRRPSARAAGTCSTRSASWPSSPTVLARTTRSSGRS